MINVCWRYFYTGLYRVFGYPQNENMQVLMSVSLVLQVIIVHETFPVGLWLFLRTAAFRVRTPCGLTGGLWTCVSDKSSIFISGTRYAAMKRSLLISFTIFQRNTRWKYRIWNWRVRMSRITASVDIVLSETEHRPCSRSSPMFGENLLALSSRCKS